MSVVTPHQTDLTTFCKFKREHKLRRALHLLLNPKSIGQPTLAILCAEDNMIQKLLMRTHKRSPPARCVDPPGLLILSIAVRGLTAPAADVPALRA